MLIMEMKRNEGELIMTQKDLNDLCTVISILTHSNSLFETLEQAKGDIPEELISEFEYLYYNLKEFIRTVGNYSSGKKDILISAYNDITKQHSDGAK